MVLRQTLTSKANSSQTKFHRKPDVKWKTPFPEASSHQLVWRLPAALIEDVMPEIAQAGDGLVLYGYIDEAGVLLQLPWIAKEGESTLGHAPHLQKRRCI